MLCRQLKAQMPTMTDLQITEGVRQTSRDELLSDDGDLVAAARGIVANPGHDAARNRLASAFMTDPRVNKIIRSIALQKNISLDDLDEVKQQSVIALVQVADRGGINHPEGAYSLSYAIIERVALSISTGMAAHYATTVSLDEEKDDDGRPIIDEIAGSWNEDELVEALDAENARSKMRQIMLLRKMNSFSGETMDNTSTSLVGGIPIDTGSFGQKESRAMKRQRPSTPRASQLKPRAEELKRIREQIDMTNEEFSAALDIGGPRLASYLYGRTEPSEEILNRAKELLSDSKRQVSEINRMFKRPAKEIVSDWVKMIGGDPNAPEKSFDDLAAILGVNIITVKRWWEGKVGLKPIRAYPYHRKLVLEMRRLAPSSP